METFAIIGLFKRKNPSGLALAASLLTASTFCHSEIAGAQQGPQLLAQQVTAQQGQAQQSQASAQPQWVFVPGSRQAKPLSSVLQGQPYAPGYQQQPTQPVSRQPTSAQPGQGVSRQGLQSQLPYRQVNTSHGTYVLVPRNVKTSPGPNPNAPRAGTALQGTASQSRIIQSAAGQSTAGQIGAAQGTSAQGSAGHGVQTFQGGQTATSRGASAKGATQPKTAGGKVYDFTGSAVVGGAQRPFQAHIPASCDRTRPSALVLVFHGMRMNGTMMRGLTNFDRLADQKGFIVVYGEAAGNWADGRTNGADDIAYVTATLDSLARVAKIDNRRVYACGLSNGGYFCQVLACALPERIAAVGVVGATMLEQAGNSLQSGSPVPIAFFLGTEDPLLPWGDGRQKDLGKLGDAIGLGGLGSIDSSLVRMGGLMSVPEVINFWAGHNHCSTTPYKSQLPVRDASDGTQVRKESYGSSGSEVVLYTIEGGGHTWPGAINLKPVADLAGRTTQNLDATDTLWQFFQSHTR